MQSLQVSFNLVPKMLEPLVSLWVPDAFVVSFKLETDESILISKARGALEKYSHKVSSFLLTLKLFSHLRPILKVYSSRRRLRNAIYRIVKMGLCLVLCGHSFNNWAAVLFLRYFKFKMSNVIHSKLFYMCASQNLFFYRKNCLWQLKYSTNLSLQSHCDIV